MKIYRGRHEGQVAEVTVDDQPLNPRLDLWNHSPTGFEWGYGGCGPAQLALAHLSDHLGNDHEAVTLHQDFKRIVVASLPYRDSRLTSQQIQWSVDSLKCAPP